jgi:hypothetical protein
VSTSRTPACFIVVAAALLGCNATPRPTYPGPQRPLTEVAVLRDSSDASILEIDGEQVSGTAWTLLPGPHDLLMRVRVFTDAPNVNWTIWSYCRARMIAVAQMEYVSRVEMRKEVAPGLADRVQMQVSVFDAAGEAQALVHTCTGKRPKSKD